MSDALMQPGSAVDLAVVRIVFFAAAVPVGASRLAQQLAELPDGLRTMPVGSSVVYELIPVDPTLARLASLAMMPAAILAAIGLFGRAAAAVWAGLAVYVIGITQLFGKVDHTHHFVWFAALLAASPCTDALSLDALRKPPQELRQSLRYGVPIRLWWLLIGTIYFFAGFWKVAWQGIGWVSPTNMRLLLHGQWAAVEGFDPLVHVDHWPVVLVLLGSALVAFELTFVVLVFTRWRWVAVAAGVTFHLTALALVNIGFTSLVVCYVAFIPWARSVTGRRRQPRDQRRPLRATVVVGGTIAAMAIAFGAANEVNGWPFATYPTFAQRFSGTRTTVTLELEQDGGHRRASVDEVFGWVPEATRNRLPGRIASLDREGQLELLSDIEDELGPIDELRVIAEVYSTNPDDPRLLGQQELLTVSRDIRTDG